jgi:2-keto-4-pentenoate hydratase/2-oxohepta-3-ene-1,7-dioic acid hydratase in catechol pathway
VPKDRDFALGLGPAVLTSDEIEPDRLVVSVRVDGHERARGAFHGFGWAAARDLAAERTRLFPGDLIAGPGPVWVEGILPGHSVEIDVPGVGVLEQVVVGG